MKYVYLTLNWVFGVHFLLIGVVITFAESPLAGLSLIAASALLLPPVRSFVYAKTNKAIPVKVRVISIFALLIVFVMGLGGNQNRKGQELATQQAKEKAEKAAQLRQDNIDYFNANREQIISSVKKSLSEKDYQSVISKTKKYLVSGDKDLEQLNTQAKNELAAIQKKQIEPVSYEIVKSENASHKAFGNNSLSDFTLQELSALPTDKKMIYRIVVSPEIKEKQVRPTIEKIISDITSEDDDIDEIILFLYSDKKLANSTYDVAKATWAPNGKLGGITAEIVESNDRSSYKIDIQVKENLDEYLQQRGQSEEKFGFTEAERRQIFKAIVAAERKARVEAEQIYPILYPGLKIDKERIKKHYDKERELSEKYKAEVRAKYGIMEDEESQITAEAFQESWPLE